MIDPWLLMLRRSVGRWGALILAVTGCALVFLAPPRVAGDPLGVMSTGAGYVALLGPLQALVAAADSIRFRGAVRSGMYRELGGSRRAFHLQRLVAATLWVWAGYGLTLLCLLGRALFAGERLLWSGLPVALTVLATLFLVSAAGLLLGWLVPHVLTPVATGIVTYLLMMGSFLPGEWFSLGGATVPLIGMRYRSDALLGIVGFQLLLGLALALLIGRPGRGQVVGAVVALVGAVAVTGTYSADILEPSGNEALTCTGAGPELCLSTSPADTSSVPPLVEDVLRRWHEVDPSTPARMVGRVGPPVDPAEVAFRLRLEDGGADGWDVALALARFGSGCSSFADGDLRYQRLVAYASGAEGAAGQVTRDQAKSDLGQLRAACQR